MSSKSSSSQTNTLPYVRPELSLAGTREVFPGGTDLHHSGYVSSMDRKTGVIDVIWYCPRQLSPTPVRIRGHVRYLKGEFERFLSEFGLDALVPLIDKHKPHITFDVHAFPRYPHTQGSIYYIAADIRPGVTLKEKLIDPNKLSTTWIPVVEKPETKATEEDEDWALWNGYHGYHYVSPQRRTTTQLEVLLKPGKEQHG